MNKTLSIFLIGLFSLTIACKKEAGEGGKASIKGTILVMDYNADFSILNSTYAGADRDVYIIYGDDNSQSDQVEASYDGVFEFKYLNVGEYTIYTYSKDSTMQSGSGEVAILQKIEISDKKEVVEMPGFIVFD